MNRPRTDLRDMFVPVIFANGEDDDIPGVIAAIEDRPVMYEDRIYQPGEAVTVVMKRVLFTKGLHIIQHGFESKIPTPDGWVRIVEAPGAREVTFAHCIVVFKDCDGGIILEGDGQ